MEGMLFQMQKFSENAISINGQNATLGTYVGAEKSDVRYKVYGSRILSNFYRIQSGKSLMVQMLE